MLHRKFQFMVESKTCFMFIEENITDLLTGLLAMTIPNHDFFYDKMVNYAPKTKLYKGFVVSVYLYEL